MHVTRDPRVVRARTIPATEKLREDRGVGAVYDRRRCVFKYIGAHRAPLQLANPIFPLVQGFRAKPRQMFQRQVRTSKKMLKIERANPVGPLESIKVSRNELKTNPKISRKTC